MSGNMKSPRQPLSGSDQAESQPECSVTFVGTWTIVKPILCGPLNIWKRSVVGKPGIEDSAAIISRAVEAAMKPLVPHYLYVNAHLQSNICLHD